ncbi:kinase-like domain-containing protein [Russula emetica]|nr:kinase-like domain-containing protein [Russula emetica]
MSTPPPSNASLPPGTPPFFVGPISAEAFLNHFLPPPSDPSSVPQFPTGLFNNFIKSLSQTESASYDKFIEAISPHVPSLIIVNTSRSSDKAPRGKFHLKLKPDCSVYMHGKRTKDDLDLSRVDFVIEMKSEADPFVLKITAYATAIMSAQYRTHTFSVLIMKDYARLIRWDHSGAVVTEPIYYNSQPHLFDFLVRYGIADSEVRGHDSTVHSSSTPEEIALARAIVPELKDVESFLVLTIPDDSDRPSERRYIISSPEPRPDIPVGRWTRSLFALDVKERHRVLVKDSWHVLLKDIKPEGELYDLLHRGKVDNIPSCLSAGDVGADIYHQTQTHKVGNDMNYKLTPHRHYRIVLGTIGRKLEEFKCTREFVNAMYAALKAHKAAHDIGILHRDISPGNILIACDDELDHNDPHESKIQGGLLIDWDLSKVIVRDDEHSGSTARQQTRTGTWQFMAAELIERPKIRHTFSHDLESFFWVLMWIVVTRVPTTWDESARSIFINGVMNPKVYSNIGSTEKSTWLKAGNPLREKGFRIRDNPILHELAMELYDSVAGQYRPRPSDQAPPTKLNPYILSGRSLRKNPEEEDKNYEIGLTFLKDYDTLLKQFEQALNAEWPSNDKASLQSIARSNASIHFYSQSQSKRSRPVADEGGPFNKVSGSKRRQG